MIQDSVTEAVEVEVEVVLRQGSARSPFFFPALIDRLADEVKQERPGTIMFTDDSVICREQAERTRSGLVHPARWDITFMIVYLKFCPILLDVYVNNLILLTLLTFFFFTTCTVCRGSIPQPSCFKV